ncbi:hypothetical protein QWY77_06385 [Thalassotalea ponticola]|uniref:hypothetical protein n=1 Tax=Thalassotalea ponticola TaxID=1523392 RepID=UPI0025B57FFB|nr:hypothetical protein [Thalassotalea ponticola]MDN3652389.1 hypothetical protein [Thalassotalea ponticola]
MKIICIGMAMLFGCYTSFAVSAEEEEQEYAEYMIVHPKPEDDWLFGFHSTISDSFYGTAKWFDSFFATDEDDDITPTSLARIRLGYEPRARDFAVFTQKFKLRVKLPNLEDRVDLLLSDEDDDSRTSTKDEADRLSRVNREEAFTASLRVVNVDNLGEFIDSRVGISGGDIFVKGRMKLQYELAEKHRFELEPSIYYYLDDGLGARLFMEYEFNYSEKQQFRVNYSMRGSESFHGYRWRHGYFYLHQIDRFRATSLGVEIYGEDNGDDDFFIDNTVLNYRFRVNAYRRWLYFEIEPFIEWPYDNDHKPTPGIALRVEGYFEKSQR